MPVRPAAVAVIACAAWNEITLRDSGRGVDPYTLFLVGESGKRGADDMVGQHGEGETISTLVALRLGLVKVVAARIGCASGSFAHMNGDVTRPKVLELVIYRSPQTRQGTVWFYQGPNVAQAAADAYVAFKRHHGLNTTHYDQLAAGVCRGGRVPARPAQGGGDPR